MTKHSDIARALVETVAASPNDAAAACDAACNLLARHGRVDTPSFLRTLESALQEYQNVRFATMRVPFSVSVERLASLKRTIEKVWKTSVHLSTTSDSSLLGGAVLRVGDELFDTSIKNEIDSLVRTLLAPLE